MGSQAIMEESGSKTLAFAYSLAVAGLAFAMALGEAFFIHFHKTVAIYQSWGGSFLFYGPIVICSICCIVPSILIWRLPKQKLLILFSAVSLALFVGFRFRGSFIWAGTFDVDISGMTTMVYPLIFGPVLGAMYAAALRTKKPQINALCLSVGVIGALSICSSFVHAISSKWIVSEFAFTRHLALLALATAVPIAAFMIDRYQEDL